MAKPVILRFIGDTKALSKSLLAVQAETSGLGTRIGKIALGVGLGVAAMGLTAGVGLAKLGGDFKTAYNTIRTNTGATGKELSGLESSFKRVLTKTPAGFGDVATAITSINQRLGLTGKPLEATTLQFVRLARITKTDVASNLEAVTGVLNNWNIKGSHAKGVTDLLFRAMQKSGVPVATLASDLSGAGVQLRSLGFSLEDSTGLLAMLGKEGLSVSDVLPGLSKAMATAAKNGVPASKAFRDVFDRIKGAKSDTKAAGMALEVFGAKAGPKFAALIREGKLSYAEFTDSIRKGDTVEKAAKDTATWTGKLGILKNQVAVVLEPLATRVFNGITNAMSALMPYVSDLTEDLVKAFGPSGVGTKALHVLGDVSGAVFGYISGKVGEFSAFMRSVDWARIIGALVTAFHATVRAVGTAVRVLVAVFWKVVDAVTTFISRNRGNFEKFGAQVSSIFWQIVDTVKVAFAAVIAVAKPVLAVLIGVVIGAVYFLTGLWDRFGKQLVDHLRVAWDAIVQIVQGALQVVRGILEVVTGIFTLHWSKVWQGIKDIFGGVWRAIVGIVRYYINLVSAAIGLVLASITTLWSGAWHRIYGVIGPIWHSITSTVSGAIGSVVGFFRDLPGRILGFVKSIGNAAGNVGSSILHGILDGLGAAGGAVVDFAKTIAHTLGGIINKHVIDPIKGFKFTIGAFGWEHTFQPFGALPELALANGALVSAPTRALIGEAGRELVLPLTRPRRAEQLLRQHAPELTRTRQDGAGATKVYEIVQHITAADPRKAARAASEEMAWAMKTAGV